MGQQTMGLLTTSFPLATADAPFTLADSSLNVSFGFGAEQAEELRARDDLRRVLKNLACATHTRAKLVSRGRLAEISRFVNAGRRDCAFSKADREDSYKQMPLNSQHSRLSFIAMR